jgi:hypothetical protein
MAVALSAIWALPAAGFIPFGVLLFVSGRGDEASVDSEGFAEFFGGSMAVLGGLVLACAIGGILLGVRLRRGRNARVGLVLLFLLFAMISGMFLASALADDLGVEPGGVALFGANTFVCLAVVVCALFAGGDRRQ